MGDAFPPPNRWVVYVIYSATNRLNAIHDFYIGHTNQLRRRIAEHNAAPQPNRQGAEFTVRGRPWVVVGILTGFQDETQARATEDELKLRLPRLQLQENVRRQRGEQRRLLHHIDNIDRFCAEKMRDHPELVWTRAHFV